MAYQGARQSSRLRSRGGPLLKFGLVRIHLVGVVGLEGVVLLLPLHIYVRIVSVVTGVAALLLLLDLVL